jgi:hypothetical protein
MVLLNVKQYFSYSFYSNQKSKNEKKFQVARKKSKIKNGKIVSLVFLK